MTESFSPTRNFGPAHDVVGDEDIVDVALKHIQIHHQRERIKINDVHATSLSP
jgi:hypothetical protein